MPLLSVHTVTFPGMPIRGSSLFQACTVKLNPGTVASKHGDKKSFHQKKKSDSFRYSRIKTIELIWSEWRDLNSRPLDPQSSALPAAPHPVVPKFSLLPACRLFADRRGAPFRNIVAVLRLERSFRSLFLHLGAMPSSATAGVKTCCGECG